MKIFNVMSSSAIFLGWDIYHDDKRLYDVTGTVGPSVVASSTILIRRMMQSTEYEVLEFDTRSIYLRIVNIV